MNLKLDETQLDSLKLFDKRNPEHDCLAVWNITTRLKKGKSSQLLILKHMEKQKSEHDFAARKAENLKFEIKYNWGWGKCLQIPAFKRYIAESFLKSNWKEYTFNSVRPSLALKFPAAVDHNINDPKNLKQYQNHFQEPFPLRRWSMKYNAEKCITNHLFKQHTT